MDVETPPPASFPNREVPAQLDRSLNDGSDLAETGGPPNHSEATHTKSTTEGSQVEPPVVVLPIKGGGWGVERKEAIKANHYLGEWGSPV
ncbi:UNVERIFIED_CONTAM: hypothetical protein K2H54_048521 [Gekko kuhli]